MKRRIGAALGAAVFTSLAITAAAADGPWSWTGSYVGVSAGYGWSGNGTVDPRPTGSTTSVMPDVGAAFLAAESAGLSPFNTNPSGFIGGVQTGYNVQFNRFVAGFEADYSWTNFSGTKNRISSNALTIDPSFGVTTTMTAKEKLDAFGTARVRMGLAALERGLIYATGGLAFGQVSSSVAFSQVETEIGRAHV